MKPPSRLLPEVSGFSLSFIGGSGGGGREGVGTGKGGFTQRVPEVEWGGFNAKEGN